MLLCGAGVQRSYSSCVCRFVCCLFGCAGLFALASAGAARSCMLSACLLHTCHTPAAHDSCFNTLHTVHIAAMLLMLMLMPPPVGAGVPGWLPHRVHRQQPQRDHQPAAVGRVCRAVPVGAEAAAADSQREWWGSRPVQDEVVTALAAVCCCTHVVHHRCRRYAGLCTLRPLHPVQHVFTAQLPNFAKNWLHPQHTCCRSPFRRGNPYVIIRVSACTS